MMLDDCSIKSDNEWECFRFSGYVSLACFPLKKSCKPTSLACSEFTALFLFYSTFFSKALFNLSLMDHMTIQKAQSIMLWLLEVAFLNQVRKYGNFKIPVDLA